MSEAREDDSVHFAVNEASTAAARIYDLLSGAVVLAADGRHTQAVHSLVTEAKAHSQALLDLLSTFTAWAHEQARTDKPAVPK